ncbi:MAG: MFS transporter [Alphaproteobacteria bacterium]|nr:MFS transporter [Alphaproteobacteria bacterium]
MNRIVTVIPGLVLTGLSLLLFAYVGYGEATRVYSEMRNERLTQLGATLQHTVDQFAQSGLPLDQLTGFDRRAGQLFEVDDALHAIQLFDPSGEAVGCVTTPYADHVDALCERGLGDTETAAHIRAEHGDGAGKSEHAGFDELNHRLSLPVRDKFGVVGWLVLTIHDQTVRDPVDAAFKTVFWAAAGLFAVFALVQLTLTCWGTAVARRALAPTFLTVLALLISLLVAVMFDLYRKGTEGQAEAMARSMAARLSSATDLGIPLELLSGIPEALEDYIRINPNIAAISLVRDGSVLFEADSETKDAQVGGGFWTGTLSFAHPVDETRQLMLTAELPMSVVIDALAAGARNFIALFFGCVLFSTVLLRAVRESASPETTLGAVRAPPTNQARLALLQPAYFLGVLADALVLSILPEISAETVARSGLASDLVSLPFSLFFIGLTLALIPASILTDRIDLRRLLVIGAALVASGLFLFGLFDQFWALCVGRAIGGIGQGIMLIAMQAYAFELVDANNRIKASAAQVLGYNGGLIVGTGIGGLLAAFNPDYRVVMLAGGVGVVAMLYTQFALPSLHKAHAPAASGSGSEKKAGMLSDIRSIMFFPDFLAVLLMVGITSKFALAGVAMFAMPLVLHKSGYGDDQVGQAMMVFASVTYLVTAGTPRIAAWLKSTDRALVIGLIALAMGMGLLGLSTDVAGLAPTIWTPEWLSRAAASFTEALDGAAVPAATGLTIALAVSLLGVGQGMIAAPVVARVASSHAAESVGRDRTIAVYRILERGGHIMGPILCGALLVAAGGNPLALSGLGLLFLALGGVYALTLLFNPPQARTQLPR